MTNPNPLAGLTRRDWLRRMGGGFGALGLAGVLAKPITASRLFAALNMVSEAQCEETRSWAPAG